MSKKQNKSAFGGHLLKNSNAKTARPLSGSSYMKIILKLRPTGLSQRWGKNIKARTLKVTKSTGQKHRVQIKELKWSNGQLRLIIRLTRKKRYAPFIRSLSGSIALQLSGANKFNALSESFWQSRPWTCILATYKENFEIKKMPLKQFSSINSEGKAPLQRRALGP